MKLYFLFARVKRLRLLIFLSVLIALIALYTWLNRPLIITCQISPVTNSSELEQSLKTILTRHQDVFAFTETGFFRGSFVTEQWEQLTCPGLPLDGKFAKQPKNADVLFYASEQGLYRSLDVGLSWEQLETADNFGFVFLHPNGVLYAIKQFPYYEVKRFVRTNTPPWFAIVEDIESNRIVRSYDLGEHWEDITTWSGPFYEILQDPVHPELVLLLGSGRRDYIYFAETDAYEWDVTPYPVWSLHNPTPLEYFFSKYNYSGCNNRATEISQPVTLNSYFHYRGENSVYPSGIVIRPEYESYTFHATATKVITVQIKLYTDNVIDLLENPATVDLWGLRLIDPTGTQQQIETRVDQTLQDVVRNGGRDERLLAGQLYRQEHALAFVSVSSTSPYTRTFNLDDFYGFGLSGSYQVQLYYSNSLTTDCNNGEWSGYFNSPVFTVNIED